MHFDEARLSPGTVIDRKYRVERRLGRGGMAIVVEATHLLLQHRVALKVLTRGSGDEALQERFLREARTTLRLRSDRVPHVFDVDRLEDGTPYIAMELLEGRTLSEVLAARGPVDAQRAADWILEACDVVAEAHAVGIIHRDLKPSNLFLARGTDGDDVLKVLDFGIAKVLEGDVELTHTSDGLGSPRYMSPEQIRSPRDVTGRTDVWSLGAVLYEIVTGKPAFDGDHPGSVGAAILTEPAPRPTEERPSLPPALDRIVARCLDKDPSGRYATVAELARALAPFGSTGASARADRVASRLTSIDRGDETDATRGTAQPGEAILVDRAATTPTIARPRATARIRAVWLVLAVGGAVLALGFVASRSRTAESAGSAEATKAAVDEGPFAELPVSSASAKDPAKVPSTSAITPDTQQSDPSPEPSPPAVARPTPAGRLLGDRSPAPASSGVEVPSDCPDPFCARK